MRQTKFYSSFFTNNSRKTTFITSEKREEAQQTLSRNKRGSSAFRCCMVTVHTRHPLPTSVIPLSNRLI